MPMLPFRDFTVNGFRGLRSLEVTELRAINLFVGGNNSGKTSILEALAILSNPAQGSEWLQVVRRRDFGRLDESLVMSLRWCFSQENPLTQSDAEDLEFSCHFTMNGAYPLKQMTSTYKEFFAEVDPSDPNVARAARYMGARADIAEGPVRNCTIDSNLEWEEHARANLPGSEQLQAFPPQTAKTLAVNDLLPTALNVAPVRRGMVYQGRFGLKCAVLLPYSYQLNTRQVSSRSEQLFHDDNSLLLDLVRQFDNDVIDIEVASFAGLRPAIYVKHKRLGVAPLSVFGDAMRRCLLLATTLTNLGPGGILLLDEIEVGIHTDALAKVFKWLSDSARMMQVQVMATTHSLEVLDALLGADLGEDDLAAYQVKQGDLQTDCRRFSAQSLKRLRFERGLDIR